VIAAVFLLLVAAVGHAAIWVAAINSTHASGWPQPIVHKLNSLCFLILLVPPPLAACWMLWLDVPSLMPWRMFSSAGTHSVGLLALECYLCLCWLSAAVTVVQRVRWMLMHDASSILRFHRSRSLGTSSILHSPDHPHHAIVHLPGNQSLELDLTERGLDVPRLPPALEGLSIVHLSDFHFTGKIGKPFFEEIVRMSNALEPEVIALTGDFCDKTRYIDWVPETLGRLRAR